MPNYPDSQQGRKARTHGILYIHGAGMPEDQKTIIGDPLSTIANGLVDTFASDELLSTRYRLATRASETERALSGLDLDIFCRAVGSQPEEKEYTIRMREVLWKPTMRKRGVLDYVPLLWLWAMAFQTHVTRIAKLEKLDREGTADWDKDGLTVLEEKSRAARRRSDLLGRLALACAGFLATLFVAFLAGEITKWLNPTWSGESPEFMQVWQITTSLICTSIVAGVLLCLLALREYADRASDKPHGRLHMSAVILTTAWLALFLVPWLVIVYYLDRVVTLLGIAASAALAIRIALSINAWWERVAFLFLVAVGIWLLTISSRLLTSEAFLRWLKSDMRSRVANYLTTLLVTAGAPLLIACIFLLELLSVLPLVGDPFKSLAARISEASQWEIIKDIHMFLTDSSRAAAARCCTETALLELAKEVDHVHVFSHSLGTVVAYETLAQIGRGDGMKIKKNDAVYRKIKTLATFGSPLNKIRTLANKTAEQKDMQTDFDYRRFDNNVVLDGPAGFRWLNFYSFQDIASDVLTLFSRATDPIRPHEFAVASANDIATAHGAYWKDRGFWNTILQAMGIIYDGRDLTRIEKLRGRDKVGMELKSLREQGILTRGQFDARFNVPPNSDVTTASGGVP